MPGISDIIADLEAGKPINLWGYMCAGKTTLQATICALGYRAIDETLQQTMVHTVGLRSDVPAMRKAGKIQDAWETLLTYAITTQPDTLRRTVLNVWVPELPGVTTIALLVERPDCIAKMRHYDRASEHFAEIRKATSPNAIIIDTEEQQVALYAALAALEGDRQVSATIRKYLQPWAVKELNTR